MRTFPEITLEFFSFNFRKLEILEPINVLTYFGFETDEPASAISLSAKNLPSYRALPIIMRSGRFKVQIISPLLIGHTLLIIVLRFPDGCGPETL